MDNREALTQGWLYLPKTMPGPLLQGCAQQRRSPAVAENRAQRSLTTIATTAGDVLVIVPLVSFDLGWQASSPRTAAVAFDDAQKVRRLGDHEGNLWVGTIASGLIRFTTPRPRMAVERPADVGFNAVLRTQGRTWLGAIYCTGPTDRISPCRA
jgi:hypothetical protein